MRTSVAAILRSSIRSCSAALLLVAACGRFDFDPPVARVTGDAAHADSAGGGGSSDGGTDANPSLITFVQMIAQQNGTASVTATFADPVTAGDLLIVGVSFDTTITSITINDSGSDLFEDASIGQSTPLVSYLFIATANAAASETFTATITPAPSSYLQLQAWEYAGIDTTNPLDDAAQATGSSIATDGMTTRPLRVSTANELLFGWGECINTCDAGTGFTTLDTFAGDSAEARILGATGSATPTMTLEPDGDNWTFVSATFRGR
jgi:hypothetical protein